MSITTLDGIVAGMQPPIEFYKVGTGAQVIGRWYTPVYAAGTPGAMAAPAGGIQGRELTGKAGLIPWTNPVSGNSYLARFAGESMVAGTLLLCDRLWENSGNSATATTAQNSFLTITGNTLANPTVVTTGAHGQLAGTFVVHITGSNSTPSIDGVYTATYIDATTFSIPVEVTVAGTAGTCYICPPPRDNYGTSVPDGATTTYGRGAQMAYEVSGATGAGTPTLAVTYVNSAGVAGKVTPNITLAASNIVGTFISLPLAAGDVGVRAVHSHIKSATQTSGTYHLILYRVLSRININMAGVGNAVDAITGGLVRAYNNTCPFLIFIPATVGAPAAISGQIIWTQG